MSGGSRGSKAIGLGVYIRVRTKPGKRAEFVRLIRELRESALEHEPDTLVFELFQSADPNEFVIFESYVDEAAQKVHENAPYHVAMSPAGWACLDGEPVIEFMKPAR